MSEELKAALARIACLEGEIAKRDETIARPEPQLNRAIQANYDLREELAACRVAVENCELFRARIVALELEVALRDQALDRHVEYGKELRAELAAIKAQEPVAIEFRQFMTAVVTGAGLLSCGKQSKGLAAELSATAYKYLLGAPVSEAKAQGVVMPEPLMAAITRADDVLHALSNWEASSVKLEQRHGPEWTKEVDAIRRELHTQLARLTAAPVQQVKCKTCDDNGRIGGPSFYAPDEGGYPCPDCSAPVQQVSVQDGFERYRLADKFCEQRLVTDDHVRAIVVDAFASGYGFGIAAAPAAPAAAAGLSLVEWTKDAEGWGGALNDAGWVFIEQCPETSALLFNNTKGPLRAAIMKYAEIVAAHSAKGVV